jgi:hypothetical protein
MKPPQHFLIFGDLHGRVLPAFALAAAWSLAHDVPVAGLLQVGDLGYWPEAYPLDEPTRKFAEDDPTELGVRLVIEPSAAAEAVFFGPEAARVPGGLWFTAGNHECFEALEERERDAAREADSFRVDSDYYGRLWCIRDGHVETLPGNLRVGALWGIHGKPVMGGEKPPRAFIQRRQATALQGCRFDVLLTHDSPRGAIRRVDGREERLGEGSEEIAALLRAARPRFAFFGHRQGVGGPIQGDFGPTQVFHLSGMELGRRAGNERYPEKNCVGVLTWAGDESRFEYVDSDWLLNCPRSAWLEWERRVQATSGPQNLQAHLGPVDPTTPPLPWVNAFTSRTKEGDSLT